MPALCHLWEDSADVAANSGKGAEEQNRGGLFWGYEWTNMAFCANPSFSKSRIHSVNCLEPDYFHLLSESTETVASRLLITLDTHLLVAETIPPKPPWDRTSPPIFRRLRGEDGRCLDLMQCWRRFSATLLAGHGARGTVGSVGDKISPRLFQIFGLAQKKQWRVMSNYFFMFTHTWCGKWSNFYKSEDFWVLHSWQEGEWCFQLAHYPSTCIYTKFGFDSLSSW